MRREGGAYKLGGQFQVRGERREEERFGQVEAVPALFKEIQLSSRQEGLEEEEEGRKENEEEKEEMEIGEG